MTEHQFANHRVRARRAGHRDAGPGAGVTVSVTIDAVTAAGWPVATELAGRISEVISASNAATPGITTAALITIGNNYEGPTGAEADAFASERVADLLALPPTLTDRTPRRLRQSAASTSGQLELDARRRAVNVDGTEVILTRREFDLLLFLARHPDSVLGRTELLRAVWGRTADSRVRTVDVHVRRLRMKLAAAAPMISTIRGVGYRFDAIGRTTVLAG